MKDIYKRDEVKMRKNKVQLKYSTIKTRNEPIAAEYMKSA